MKNTIEKSNQIIGNVGLFYVSYLLSKMGWNVLPTSRNTKGIDIIIYNHNARKKISIQVKALSGKTPVPLGKNTNNLFSDYFIICRDIHNSNNNPEIFIMKTAQVKKKAHKGEKDGRISYWLQPKDYLRFNRKLSKVLGYGY